MPQTVSPRLLALLASPRPRGANARLLSTFLKACSGWEIRRIDLSALRIRPYSENLASRPMSVRDPMSGLIRAFDRADALVLAAPVYFYGFPAQAKAVIDRCQPLWADPRWRRRRKRPAIFISTCAAARRSEFEVIRREAKAFFNTIGFQYLDELFVPGLDRADAARRLGRGQALAVRLARRLDSVQPARVRARG